MINQDHWAPLSCHYVTKDLVHAFTCAYIELWMHLGSLESNSYASLVLSKLPACTITRYTHAKHEPILKLRDILSALKFTMQSSFSQNQWYVALHFVYHSMALYKGCSQNGRSDTLWCLQSVVSVIVIPLT